MSENKTIRVDKFLWSVRIYKTRSIASDECRKGRIMINDIQVKPSRIVINNEIIFVKKPPVIYTYRVIEPIENRVSAKLVGQFIEDLTSEDEKAKLDIRPSLEAGHREQGYRSSYKKRKKADR